MNTLDDGTVIVVAEGAATGSRGAGEDEDPTDEEPNEIEDLKKQITDLQAENATLKGNQVLNKAQREILNRVSKLGGPKVLDGWKAITARLNAKRSQPNRQLKWKTVSPMQLTLKWPN